MIGIFVIALVISFVASVVVTSVLMRRHKVPFFNTVTEDMPPQGVFIREDTPSGTEMWNLNGVPWHDAIVPPKSHTCWTQTRGGYTDKNNVHVFVRRCACGAISMNDWDINDIYWLERNTRTVRK
jgi:hypothetical protein